MSESPTKRPIPARALASVLFACCSFFLFGLAGAVHWLPNRFPKDNEEVFRTAVSLAGPIRDRLDIAYRVMAVIALLWCIWAWRTEQRVAAIVAAVFAGLAMFLAVFIVV